jgi:general stress protein CsbA
MKRINFYEISLVFMIIGGFIMTYGYQYPRSEEIIGYFFLDACFFFLSLIFRLFPAPTKKHWVDIVLAPVIFYISEMMISALSLTNGWVAMFPQMVVPIIAIYLLIRSTKERATLNT